MSKRPERLRYTGDGKAFFNGVPARDLDERDIKRLSDARLADITAPNPATGKALYVEPKATPKKADEPKGPRKQADAPKAVKAAALAGDATGDAASAA